MVSKHHHHHHHRHHHSSSQRKSSLTAEYAETMGRPVSLIETDKVINTKKYQHPNIRFLLLDCPTIANLPYYLEEFKRYNVNQVIRCQQFKDDDSKSQKYNYDITLLIEQNIQVHDLPFQDGGIPPPNVIKKWLSILEAVYQEQQEEQQSQEQPMAITTHTIAVHCMAGLGRAPVLVAIALIELFHMEPLDTVEFIRSRRKGAFNSAQISFLDFYKPVLRNNNVFGLKINSSSSSSGSSSGRSLSNSRDFHNSSAHKSSPTLTYFINYFTSIFGTKHLDTVSKNVESDGKMQQPAAKNTTSASTTTTIATCVN